MAQTASSSTQLCPTCGSRVNPGADRCLVCGRLLNETNSTNGQTVAARRPGVRLSLPVFLIVLILFFGADAALAYYVIRSQPGGTAAILPSRTPTVTQTPTVTTTPLPTTTNTPLPTPTPLPDIPYKVADGDTCLKIAIYFHISVRSLVDKNNLPEACDTLSIGQQLLVPQPTPTPSPQPSATLGATEAAKANCDVADYTIQDGDSLLGIAHSYNVSMEDIKTFNGMLNDTVMVGNHMLIPLCKRKPADGSTPTPTQPPDYPAPPTLLLPLSGAVFSASDQPGLQWSSIGTLRDNEAYAVTVIDLTAESTTGQPTRLYETTKETQYGLPANFKPSDKNAHILQWFIQPVRQVGTDQAGNPLWAPAGPVSETRQFVWMGK